VTQQRQIARVLQTVEGKIRCEENHRNALQSVFSSLLHYLMTGKIRVKPEDAPEEVTT